MSDTTPDLDFIGDDNDIFGSTVLAREANVSPMVRTENNFTAGLSIPLGLTDAEFRHVIGAAYTAWVGSGLLPDVDAIRHYCTSNITKKKIGIAIGSPQFKDAMASRGVPWEDGSGLTGVQMHVMQLITNPTDRRGLQQKLRAAGVTYTQYRAWLKMPQFSQYLNRVTEGMLIEHIPDFNTVLTNKALSGDMNALKFVYELSGRHDPNRQQVTDLQAVIQSLVEIVTRNVTDPATLTRISNELHLTLVSHNVIKGEVTDAQHNAL